MKEKIFLVGLGNMGLEYAKVLNSLGVSYVGVGRSADSSAKFKNITGAEAFNGGMDENIIRQNSGIKKAIVTVDIDELGKVTRFLVNHGVREILCEKPGGLNFNDIKNTARLAKAKGAKVYIAYNRRFYASVARVIDHIKRDGGVLSFTFEFTELAHITERLDVSPSIKKEWFMANSSHVADLAFFIAGRPKKMVSFNANKNLSWYGGGSIFAGAGISNKNALFSYHANWQSGGRWGVEIMTPKRRLILRPLEKLFIQERGSLDIYEEKVNDRLDKEFKPGLYLQTKAFLSDKNNNFLTVKEQSQNEKYYDIIIKGGRSE